MENNTVSGLYKEIEERFITKNNYKETPKMKRNLQPEIEKLKSINLSLRGLGYVSDSEKDRLASELNRLIDVVDAL